MALRYLFALALVLLSFASSADAPMSILSAGEPSQTTPVLPDPLTTEAANALISRLSDTEVRSLLLDQLNTQVAAIEASQNVGGEDFVYHLTTGAWQPVVIAVQRIPELFSGQGVLKLLRKD